jgi:hypothetical protein
MATGCHSNGNLFCLMATLKRRHDAGFSKKVAIRNKNPQTFYFYYYIFFEKFIDFIVNGNLLDVKAYKQRDRGGCH